MQENMSISVNGQSQVPPGFRFHPTEEELLQYYLRKKVSYEKIDLDVIRDVDLNKLEPWDIQDKCKIGTTPQNDWYFFSHKDKKYPTGTRTNRATAVGFWKATGRDKVIYSNGKRIGMRKTLVFYKGRAPHGQKSDWIMHEYRLDDNINNETNIVSNAMGDTNQEEGWVVCRIFKKKNHLKSLESPLVSSMSIAGEKGRSHLFDYSCEEGALEQIIEQMGRGRGRERDGGEYHDKFMKLPSLDSPKCMGIESQQNGYDPINEGSNMVMGGGTTNWATLDRLVASQLNGQTEESGQLSNCFNDPTMGMGYCGGGDHDLQFPTFPSSTQDHTSDIHLWNFPLSTSSLSTSESLCHVLNTSM